MIEFYTQYTWPLLALIALAVGITAQCIKFVVKSITHKNIGVQNFLSYGGMPSSHAAFVAGVTTIIAMTRGINSPEVVICVVFGLLVLRDALGLRNYVDRTMEDVQDLAKKIPHGELRTKNLADLQVGHTRLEVLVGLIVGTGLAILYTYILHRVLG